MKDALAKQLASLGIGTPAKRGRKPGSGKRAHALKGTTRPAKYRDPKTGKTWAGVGMTPLWITPAFPNSGACASTQARWRDARPSQVIWV
jgi:DNA-binding protein H-NS